MPFSEVRPKKTFAYIAEQIVEAVRNREFKPGDLLPPERDLAQKFRVSRQAVREALSALQLAGVVETRAGSGTYIRSVPEEGLGTVWSLGQEESPLEVLEARLLVEPQVAALAAQRATNEDLTQLERLAERMQEWRHNTKQFGELDLAFHLLLAKASGNSVLHRFVEATTGYVNQQLWRFLRERAYQADESLPDTYLRHHQAILTALRARDSKTAAGHMQAHLEAARRVWFDASEDD